MLGKNLSHVFRRTFGGRQLDLAALLDEAGRLVIERLASSDALYHDAEHTALVTLVAQDMLRGLLHSRRLSPEDWVHSIFAALLHDVGYVRGICRGDRADRQIV